MKEERPFLVSIISLNWNSTQVTCDFLRSIQRENTYKHIEVIIVDNNSTIDPTDALLKTYPGVNIIRNKENLGFAGGNNVGIRAAKGDYLFIVNNDTEFTPGLIEGMLEVFSKHPDAGIVSPKIHYFFNKGTIEYAGYNSVNVFTGRNGMIGCQEKDNGQYNQVRQTNYAHGGAMLIPKKVVDEVGTIPELFFLYYEELDWSEQIKRKGYKIYVQPNALIYHKESMTTGKESPLKTYYLTRNRILFMRRNMKSFHFAIFMMYFTCFTTVKNTASYLFKGKRQHLRSFWRGVMWHFDKRITFRHQ